MSTNEIKLHVGYIGKTRNGKRVEVTEHVPAKNGKDYFVLSNDACVWADGVLDRRQESCSDIIGPWDEPKPEEPTTCITGQWYGWNGGECPVHPKSEVEVRLCNPAEEFGDMTDIADGWDWVFRGSSGIVSFRVVTPYVPIADATEPKLECWVNVYNEGAMVLHGSEDAANKGQAKHRIRCVRMIEVDDQ